MKKLSRLTWLMLLLLASCEPPTFVYNICKCTTGPGGMGVVKLRSYGQEERLQEFVRLVRDSLGTPNVTYLNYTIEEPEEFFHPERRAINPEILSSPFGLQKIMVWRGLHRPKWHSDSLEISLQIEEKQTGNRPIDPYYVTLEWRIRSASGADLLSSCPGPPGFRRLVDRAVLQAIGGPGPERTSMVQQLKEQAYTKRKNDYSVRVKGILDPKCYPPVAHRPGSNVFRLQLCEDEGIRDTLVGTVKVLDAAGDPLPHYLYDLARDTFTEGVAIYDGYLGYALYTEEIGEVAEIRFQFSNGRDMLLYQAGDDVRQPLPFRSRYTPDYFRRRRENQEPHLIFSRHTNPGGPTGKGSVPVASG